MTGGAFHSDLLAAVRRLRRRLTLWRVVAVLAIVAALTAVLWRQADVALGDHVARVRISGLILNDQRRLDLLDKLARSARVRAVILRIDSPGGTVVGSEALHDAIRRVAEKKPVVAVLDGVAASGGYIAALAADRIFARRNTITGSIGVIFQWAELDQLLGRLGVKMQAIRSGPFKARPNPFEPLDPEVRAVTEALIRDSFDWFVDLLTRRRGLTPQTARRLADGRVWTGHQALALKLVDAIGDERAARKWLAEKKGVPESLKTVERKPESLTGRLGLDVAIWRGLLSAMGLETLVDAGAGIVDGGLALDGLLALWHPRARQEARGPR
ncbi:MAG TPA: signal peptide peptidase SppA [Thermopetrobacter sp.]|nr:signal peptide peptidase SppA [Thermopetrobacter sp.]